jgi:hypothetical protein
MQTNPHVIADGFKGDEQPTLPITSWAGFAGQFET